MGHHHHRNPLSNNKNKSSPPVRVAGGQRKHLCSGAWRRLRRPSTVSTVFPTCQENVLQPDTSSPVSREYKTCAYTVHCELHSGKLWGLKWISILLTPPPSFPECSQWPLTLVKSTLSHEDCSLLHSIHTYLTPFSSHFLLSII